MTGNKCILYHLNIRGFGSKRKSFEKIVDSLNPSIITLNETALKFKKKPNIKGYSSFQRNRINQNMGGVATLVKNENKNDFIKVSEGANSDEFLVTRHNSFFSL